MRSGHELFFDGDLKFFLFSALDVPPLLKVVTLRRNFSSLINFPFGGCSSLIHDAHTFQEVGRTSSRLGLSICLFFPLFPT